MMMAPVAEKVVNRIAEKELAKMRAVVGSPKQTPEKAVWDDCSTSQRSFLLQAAELEDSEIRPLEFIVCQPWGRLLPREKDKFIEIVSRLAKWAESLDLAPSMHLEKEVEAARVAG